MDKFIDILRAIRDTLYPEIVTKHAEVMAAEIKLGTMSADISTLAYDAPATVDYDPALAVLHFGIPQGIVGADGIDGTNGIDGIDGKSAYEIAVLNGFVGTEIQWLASLEGAVGATGATGAPGADGLDGTGTGDILAANNLSDLTNAATARTNLDVYSKTETDTALSGKADQATTYTKTETDTALSGKADQATTYTKTETDTALSGKADQATTYTKTETDTALGLKADDTDLANYLLLAGGDLTGAVTMKYVAVPANDIVVSSANFFSKTISGTTTLTVSSIPASPKVSIFILELTNGGSAVVTWWSGIKWDGGTVPTLTVSGLDILVFYTRDGGTTWRGTVRKDSK